MTKKLAPLWLLPVFVLLVAAGSGVLENTAIKNTPFITFTNGYFMGEDPSVHEATNILIISMDPSNPDFFINHNGAREISFANGVVNASDEGLYLIGSGGDGYSAELFENGTAQFNHSKVLIKDTSDLEFIDSASGPILRDRASTNRFRLKVCNGVLGLEPL